MVNSLLFNLIFHFIVVLYITHKSDYVANNKVAYYLHVKSIINFAPEGHGTKFSCVGGGVRL